MKNPPTIDSSATPMLKIRMLKEEHVDWRTLHWLQSENTKTQIDIEKLIESIVQNGLIRGFRVWEDEEGVQWILDGHHLKRALEEIESRDLLSIPDQLPAHFIECENKKEAAKLVVVFSATYAKFSATGLMEHLMNYEIEVADVAAVVHLEAFDVSEVEALAAHEGQSFDEVITAEAQEDDMSQSAMPKFAITVLGDLYELKSTTKDLIHRVYCADSTEYDSIDKLMDGELAELLFSSPPYSNSKDFSVDEIADFITSFLPIAQFLAIHLPIKKDKKGIDPYWGAYVDKAKDCNYQLLAWNIWNKAEPGDASAKKAIFPIIHDFILVFGKEAKELVKVGKLSDSVFTLPYKSQKAFGKKVTDILPVELPYEYIIAMTNKGDIVADPFVGSGSTIIACEQAARACYAQDINPSCVDISVARYIKFMRDAKEAFEVWRNGEKLKDKELDDYVANAFSS